MTEQNQWIKFRDKYIATVLYRAFTWLLPKIEGSFQKGLKDRSLGQSPRERKKLHFKKAINQKLHDLRAARSIIEMQLLPRTAKKIARASTGRFRRTFDPSVPGSFVHFFPLVCDE